VFVPGSGVRVDPLAQREQLARSEAPLLHRQASGSPHCTPTPAHRRPSA
jgi:hypothetical protein